MQKRGKLFVLVGPPSVGKNTLINGVCDFSDSLIRMPSATTRKPRVGEKNGIDKFFITEKEFDKRIAQGDFLEWQVIHGNKYGVLKSVIEDRINSGKDYIADVEVLGAMELKKYYKKDAFLIFVIPPSLKEIENRIKARGTETEKEIKLRLLRSRAELAFLPKCDQVLLNDNLERAIYQLEEITGKKEVQSLGNIDKVKIESVGFVVSDQGQKMLIKNQLGKNEIFNIIVKKGDYPHKKLIAKIKKLISNISIIDDGVLTRKYNKGLDVCQPLWVSFSSIKGDIKIKFYYIIEVINCPKLSSEYHWISSDKIEDFIDDIDGPIIIKKIKNFLSSK